MVPFSSNPAVFKDEDLIRMQNRADALGDNKTCPSNH